MVFTLAAALATAGAVVSLLRGGIYIHEVSLPPDHAAAAPLQRARAG